MSEIAPGVDRDLKRLKRDITEQVVSNYKVKSVTTWDPKIPMKIGDKVVYKSFRPVKEHEILERIDCYIIRTSVRHWEVGYQVHKKTKELIDSKLEIYDSWKKGQQIID